MDLYIELITPEKIIFEGPVGLVDVPGTAGRFTVLRDHAPIISTLSKGIIRIIGKDGVERKYLCFEGVVECFENHLTILIDQHPQEPDF